MPRRKEHRFPMYATFVRSHEAPSFESTVDDNQDVEEFPLLLKASEVRELIEVARQQGLSAAGLARCLIRDYLLWIQSDSGTALRQELRRQVPGTGQ